MRIAYLGDAQSAAALRLAGVHAVVAPAGRRALRAALERAAAGADLVLVGPEQARELAGALPERIAHHPLPPITVLPPLGEAAAPLDTGALRRARAALGLV